MPQISSTVGQATRSAAPLVACGISSDRITAIVTATKPTSQSSVRAITTSAAMPISVSTRSRSSAGASALILDPAAADHGLTGRRRLAPEALGGLGLRVDAALEQVAPAEHEED